MTTRRTATRVEIPVPSSSSSSSSSTNSDDKIPTMRAAAAATAHHSPTLPTRLESLLLAIYPTTLLLGSLFSQLSASSRRATYLPDSQAYSAADAPSYFAKKGNVFNVYFVKIGWFWISLAWAGFVFTHRGLSKRGGGERQDGGGGEDGGGFWTRVRVQALARYAVVTGVWILVTQWCFGPALIDRSFRWTGGKCLALSSSSSSLPPPEAAAQVEAMSDIERALTHAACKAVGGRWAGGHDISGHVFLLILGSAMLWLEILPVVLTNTPGLREARRVRGSDGNVTSSAAAATGTSRTPDAASETKEGGPTQNLSFPTKLSLSVAALSWWMLLMTAAFFHTWFEKFTGLVVAFSAIWGIYFLPRGFPGWRRVVGMPAV